MTACKRANERECVGFCGCKLREESERGGKMTAWKRTESGGLTAFTRAKK